MKYYLCYLFLCFFGTVYGQVERVQHEVFTKQDGIELDNINTLAFDKDGFLWLGGDIFDNRSIILSDKKLVLQRFNGKTFHSIPIPEELDIVKVVQLFTRDDGKMYLNDEKKIVLFDPFSSSFERVPSSFEHLSEIYEFNEEHYILSQIGRNITLNKLGLDLSFEPLFQFTSDQLRFVIDSATRFFPLEDYWLIGDDNFPIVAIENDGNVLKTFDGEAFARRLGASKGKVWMDEVLTHKGGYYAMLFENEVLHKLDPASIELTPLSTDNAVLKNLHVKFLNDSFGKNIIASSQGTQFTLSNFNKEEGLVRLFQDKSFGSSRAMTLISENIESDLWMGTSDNAELHHFKFPKKEVKVYKPNMAFRGISKFDKNKYLVASETQGWFEFDTSSNTFEGMKLTANGIDFKPGSSRNFFKDGDTIWSHSGNIIQVNMVDKTVEVYRLYPLTCMVRPTDTTLVYGTNRYNLMQFNIRAKRYDTLAKTDSLEIHDLEYRKDLELIVGATDKGMLTHHLGTGKTSFYNNPSQLEDPFLLMADYHPDYGYLLGSRSGIITAFNPRNGEFKVVYKDALKAGIATVLFRDDIWWISTFNGMVAFNSKDKTTTRFSEKDGFSHNEGNRYSAFDTGDGLLFGTIAGLNYFKPENLQPETLKSTLELLKVRSYNQEEQEVIDVFDRKKLTSENGINLPPEFKELQLDFALTHNVQNLEHRFRYKINDEDYIDIKEEQSIRFPILAAGEYNLIIEARDFSSKLIGEPLVLRINSKNFFYKTWWFNVSLALLIILLLLYFLKQSRLKQKLQERFSQELILSQEEERTRIAKELHDSVGQQLTLIKQRAQNVVQPEITKMTHNALEEVRSISRGLYPSFLKQLGLTECIEQLVYDLDEESSTFFSTDIDLIDSFFTKEGTLNYYRFIQETLTNVVKHANAKSVLVTIKCSKNMVKTTIADNGVGFDVKAKETNKSLGLKTLTERVRILKGTLQIQSKPGVGTTIIAEIPKK